MEDVRDAHSNAAPQKRKSVMTDDKMHSFLSFSLDTSLQGEKSKTDKLKEWTIESRPVQLFLALVIWIGGTTLFYVYQQNLTGAQAFFATIDSGFSIGFGALGPSKPIPAGYNYSNMTDEDFHDLNISIVSVGCYNQAAGGGPASGCEWYTVIHIFVGTILLSMVLGYYAAYIVYKCDDWKDGIAAMAKKEAEKAKYSPPDPTHKPGKADNRKASTTVAAGPSSWDTMYSYTLGSSLFRTLAFYLFLTFVGIIFGMVKNQDPLNVGDDPDWSFGKSMLFSVSAMSTGGLVSPNIDDFSMVFCGVLSAVGVISYGMAIGAVADIFSDYELNRLISQKVKGQAETEEIEFVQKLQESGGQLTKDKFLAIELMKMGKVAQEDLDLIDERWSDMDVDADGSVSTEEMVAAMYFEMADADGSATLDKREFEFLLSHMSLQIPSVNPREGTWGDEFDGVDLDNSGCLTRKEFIVFWRKFRDDTIGSSIEGATAIASMEGKARRPYSLTAV